MRDDGWEGAERGMPKAMRKEITSKFGLSIHQRDLVWHIVNTQTLEGFMERFRLITVSKQVTVTKTADMTYSDFVGMDCVKDLPDNERDQVWKALLEETQCYGYAGNTLEVRECDDGGDDEAEFEDLEEEVAEKVEEVIESLELPSQQEAERLEREKREAEAREKAQKAREKADKVAKLKAELAELEKA